MKAKTTQAFLRFNPLYFFVLGIFLSSNTFVFAQTVTDIFPTRVTTSSKVTIVGTDFTETTIDNISIVNIGITAASRTLVSSTEMTFEISQNSGSDITNRILTIGGGVNASQLISYIAPQSRSLTTSASYFVKEIYTNWDYDGQGFWRSNYWVSAGKPTHGASCPNDFHELLGYKVEGPTADPADDVIYSTGVNDALLESRLLALGEFTSAEITSQIIYKRTVFKAYSTNGVQGRTNYGNYILAGDLIDINSNGDYLTGSAENSTNGDLSGLPNIYNLSIFDAIIDGNNGLELGTGISNFNVTTDIRFYSGNGQPGAIGDNGTPDLLISQIAQAGGTDLYYYADNLGNVVGYPIKLRIAETSSTTLANWRLDLYSFPGNQPFSTSRPYKRGFTSNDNEFRPLRFAAFQLEDFGITTAADVAIIENVNMAAGGTADIAFLAYNKAAFDIKAPVSKPILPGYVCKTDGTSSVTFTTDAGIDIVGGVIVDPSCSNCDQTLSYEWSKYNVPEIPAKTGASFTINNVEENDIATYKVKISNANGTIILPVNLSQGGTPYTWSGSSWSSPYGTPAAKERGLVFAGDYNGSTESLNVDIDGCDCKVASGVNVTIGEGKKVNLYGAITVDPAIPASPPDISGVAAGTFTLLNNASLVQIKPVTINQNSGPIKMKRQASGLHANDYVFWSTPVEGFEHANIPGNLTFEWDTNLFNASNSTEGNWVSPPNTTMTAAKGYIKRVSSAANIVTDFVGKPINGAISIAVNLTTATQDSEDSDWNLIGNPYPSAINAVDFLKLTENNSIEGAVYLWTHYIPISSTPNPTDSPFYQNFVYNYGDQYLTHNNLGTTPSAPGGTSFNGNIAAGQAFFVKTLSNGDVTFKNELRYDSSENGYDNTNFFRSGSETATVDTSEKQLIWLSLVQDNSVAVSTLLGYAKDATYEKDRMFDARTTSDAYAIYSMIANEKMIIQGRPLPFENSDRVPLGVSIPQNGIYKIAIDKLEGSVFVDQAQAIYLEDTYLNVVHDLRASPYTFTEVMGTVNDRFLLRYTPSETLAVNESIASETFAFIKNSELKVRSSRTITSTQVYDLNGKQVANYVTKGNSTSLDVNFQFARGIYLAVITLDHDLLVKKKLIN